MNRTNLSRTNPWQLRKFFYVFALAILLVFGISGNTFGLQAHNTPEEGFFSHQLGHLFFILSMAVFAFWLQRTGLVRKRGWRFLQLSCFFFILWNMDAIAGHTVELWISEKLFTGPVPARGLKAEKGDLLPYIYFFLKMDHFLCVPAMIFLFLGLRKLRADSSEDYS